ncbi:hypothetical protein [Bradyrhizobium cytisi]|uniref:Uncharacterized protein n=1 Tax=Bradyrhizobium cytisi TaxID=515489 RepID=A0A5S4WXJ1_9BRAD|nr:hypothetical protein [Bradyrhizobium cytisi]TYL86804.1 hypothetical protein FXB38_05985 [Bradyrhizobium cytisi]
MAKAKKRAKKARTGKKATTARKVKKAKKVASRRQSLTAKAALPSSPIYVSGPNGELERCDWSSEQNIYVCKVVSDGDTAPAGALMMRRATRTA